MRFDDLYWVSGPMLAPLLISPAPFLDLLPPSPAPAELHQSLDGHRERGVARDRVKDRQLGRGRHRPRHELDDLVGAAVGRRQEGDGEK